MCVSLNAVQHLFGLQIRRENETFKNIRRASTRSGQRPVYSSFLYHTVIHQMLQGVQLTPASKWPAFGRVNNVVIKLLGDLNIMFM